MFFHVYSLYLLMSLFFFRTRFVGRADFEIIAIFQFLCALYLTDSQRFNDN